MRGQYRPYGVRRSLASRLPATTVPMLLFVSGAVGYGVASGDFALTGLSVSSLGCNIKGNISLNTGERIYHMPGQTYYDMTRISPEHGERWFCSEDEARRAGWRKAKV